MQANFLPQEPHRGFARLPVQHPRRGAMRSGILWLIGVPIPLILLLAYCTGHL